MAAVTGVMILITLLLALEPLADEILREQPAPQAPEVPPAPKLDDEVDAPTMALEIAQQAVAELEAQIATRRATPVVERSTIEALEAQLAALSQVENEARARLVRVEEARERANQELDAAHRAETVAAASLEVALERLDRESRRTRVRFLPGERYEKTPLLVEARPDGLALGGFDEHGTMTLISEERGRAPSIESLLRLLGTRSPQTHQLIVVIRQDALEEGLSLRDNAFTLGWEVGWQLWDAAEGGFFDPPKLEPLP